jgi:hypothetical protein
MKPSKRWIPPSDEVMRQIFPKWGKREKPQNCQAEPPYPGHDTVIVALRDPNMTAHSQRPDCPIEHPHLISECGAWH